MADRISQIAMTAQRVAPAGVGAWRSTSRMGPTTSVVIAPADLIYLTEKARSAERAEAEIERLSEQIAQLHIDLDFERDVSLDMESRFSSLLCELTDGRMSKTNYDVWAMVQEVEAAFERWTDEELERAQAEARESAAYAGRLKRRMKELADEMKAQHGQSWNSVAGQRILNVLAEVGND